MTIAMEGFLHMTPRSELLMPGRRNHEWLEYGWAVT